MDDSLVLREGRRERHKRARRAAILEAARSLLREDAGHGLTKDAIAARADVAPATVYNLVGTRPQLLAALADDLMGEVERRLSQAPSADPLTRARAVIERACDVILEDPAAYAGVVRGWNESGRLLRRGPIGALQRAFSDARTEGLLLAEVDDRLLASSVATACLGAVHQWAAGLIDGRKLRARARFSLELALAAAARPATRKDLVRALHTRRGALKREA